MTEERFSPLEKERLLRLLWKAARYTPTVGDFPVHDPDGSLRIMSHGQQEIHDTRARKIMVTGGVRGGKSQFLAMELLTEVFKENGLIWLVAPDFEQAKSEFNYMLSPLKELGFIVDEGQPEKGGRFFVTEWGCRVQTKSAKELTTLASFAPHVLAGLEMGQQPHTAYDKLQERALEYGARILMSGTLEDSQPWYADLWQKWQGPNEEDGRSFSLPSWSNTVKFPGGRNDPKIKELEKGVSPEVFLQRCGAVPYKPNGLVFKAYEPKIHLPPGGLPFNPKLPIELAIDPAQHTYAILAIQWRPLPGLFTVNLKGERLPLTEVRVIDQVYEHDITAYEIIPMVKDKPWYKYIRTGVIDVAGTQRQANKSQVQIWKEETGITLRSKAVSIPQGIEVVRHRLRVHPDAKQPLVLFDYRLRSDHDYAGRANGLLAEFGLYQWPTWTPGQATAVRPIDANNDACKALGYWLYDRFGPAIERRPSARKSVIRRYF
jgi:hypothetical protein